MSDLYSIDEGGGQWFNLADEFDSALDAQTFATSIGHAGTAVLRSVYLAEPVIVAHALDDDKVLKILELTAEGDRRCLLVSPLFESVLASMALGAAVKLSSLEMLGIDYVNVGTAYAAAVPVILALPNEAAVDAYNVATDPSWP